MVDHTVQRFTSLFRSRACRNSMKSMVKRWGFIGRGTRKTGGDHLLAHLERVAGAPPEEVHGELMFSEDIAVLVYRFDAPVPHFLYVTYGMSRTRSSAPVAGTQTEFTLRVPAETAPPEWPVRRLRRLARYARSSGNPVEPGHYMDVGVPMCAGATTSGLIFVADPLIPLLSAPTGRVSFVNALPVTADELDAALRWDPLQFAGRVGEWLPLGVGKHDRASLLIDAPFTHLISSLTEKDGSSIAAVASSYFAVDQTGRIDMPAHTATHLLRAMKWRLGYGRPFAVVGEGETGWARFVPSESVAVDFGNDNLSGPHVTVGVDRTLRHEILAVLDAAPGTYRFTTAPLSVHVIDPKR